MICEKRPGHVLKKLENPCRKNEWEGSEKWRCQHPVWASSETKMDPAQSEYQTLVQINPDLCYHE